MLEIIPDGMETRTLETVESEIILLRDQTARNMLEIGKRLIEAQGLCPKGQWKSWLSDNVQFSYRTAARMMAAYREFGADPGLSRLDSSKIYALLDAPEEMRAELRADPKALEDKSVRELQAEIKRRKQAEARIAELEAGLDAAMDKSDEEIEAARHEGRREAAAEIAQLETRLYESQAREQAARSALMDAQMVKPDTALAAENARLQSELLKAHDALNRAGAGRSASAPKGWNQQQKQVNARAQAALDGMVRAWLTEQSVFKAAQNEDGKMNFYAVCDWAVETTNRSGQTSWGTWAIDGGGTLLRFSTRLMGGASLTLDVFALRKILDELYFDALT